MLFVLLAVHLTMKHCFSAVHYRFSRKGHAQCETHNLIGRSGGGGLTSNAVLHTVMMDIATCTGIQVHYLQLHQVGNTTIMTAVLVY